MTTRLLLLACVACTRAEPTPPSPPPPPRPTPVPAPIAEPCAAREHVLPKGREDVAWTRRVADEMAKGITRKRLVCLFGTPAKPNGDFVEVTPRSPVFSSAIASASTDHPEESIEVRYAAGSRPQVASLERVLGASKDTVRIHFDSPHVRIIHLPAPEDVSIRALLTLDKDDRARVSELRLDVSDLRGWDPPEIRCWDGAHLRLSAATDRLPHGKWTFVVSAATKPIAQFECNVPADILDIGTCTPRGDKPPGAVMGSMATSIELNLPGFPPAVDLTITRDGAPVARHHVELKYSRGVCKTASEWIRL
jgi:hypothetical protein